MSAPLVKVVLDANVLYPFTLRDTLLRLAAEGFFQPYWSDDILTEMTSSLISTGRMTEVQAARLRREMEKAFPEAMATGYGRLIAQMKNEPEDRHVAAAAVKAGASVVVTDNLHDFELLPRGLKAQSADTFLYTMLDLDGDAVVRVLREQAAALHRPSVSFEELLDGMARFLPRFIEGVRGRLAG